jgi:prolyl oligopeptidase
MGIRIALMGAALGLVFSAGSMAAGSDYPAASVDQVTDTYFGTEVIDPYRWMEQKDSPALKQFLDAQNGYARTTLDRLADPHARMLNRIKQLQRGTTAVRFVNRVGNQYFFFETPVGEMRPRLAMRAAAGGETRVLLEAARLNEAGRHASIDFFSPSRDGSLIAVAISQGGAEDWTFRFIEVATGKLLPDQVSNIVEPIPAWTADGKAIYYSRLQSLAPDAPESTRLENIRIYRHVLGTGQTADEPVFDPGVVADIAVPAQFFPSMAVSPDGRFEIASVSRGTEWVRTFWLRDLKSPSPSWRKIADFADRIPQLIVHGGRVFAINQKTSNGQVLVFDAQHGVAADGKVIIDDPDFLVATSGGFLAPASDALYVGGMRNGTSVIRRAMYADLARTRDLKLPVAGSLIEFTVDNALPGFSFALQAPTLSSRLYRYDPDKNTFADTRLYTTDPADFSRIVTRKVEVESTDGARVPLTITMRKDLKLDGSNPTLMTVYGAYGANVPMWFSAPNLAWYERGGILVHVHARGGGEKGEGWHQAALRTRKQHTIDDVIAAARWLIDTKHTSAKHLAVAGKSAGGIPAGGAIVQRPELFSAALIRVGVVDLLRVEQFSTGPANTLEYGTVSKPDEFRVLHAISPYANVRDGIAYPAVMLETGINDPRVPSWQLAKMTARLQAATSSERPILLRVDYNAGHGIGSDKDQLASLMADEFTFLGWQLGMAGFSPK